ncbi:MAG: serine/threonine protein phosphatase [Candidatus Accumulibacter sp.]|uniref:serine/threonine protein phosphatase n=1 Tax=Accumulibacter sp. TaxID=2053492 RepID=UPI00287A8B67|nr:serine/threonine protein phosphatase [Accumulibacter sp.]MDS4015729.1 serine/threonine protein phosphatase [Accumulibacter sp.]
MSASAGSAVVASLQYVKGVPFPGDIRCRQILVTGPPGAGKSTLIMRLGGWSEEGYLDLGRKHWWRSEILTVRPREIHLGMPFIGLANAAAVFDVEFLQNESFPAVDFARIILPPRKRYFFSVDWYRRYVFEFLLPPADLLLARRRARAQESTHPVDRQISLEICAAQLEVFRRVAEFLHARGFYVYHRETMDCAPQRFLTAQSRP